MNNSFAHSFQLEVFQFLFALVDPTIRDDFLYFEILLFGLCSACFLDGLYEIV